MRPVMHDSFGRCEVSVPHAPDRFTGVRGHLQAHLRHTRFERPSLGSHLGKCCRQVAFHGGIKKHGERAQGPPTRPLRRCRYRAVANVGDTARDQLIWLMCSIGAEKDRMDSTASRARYAQRCQACLWLDVGRSGVWSNPAFMFR